MIRDLFAPFEDTQIAFFCGIATGMAMMAFAGFVAVVWPERDKKGGAR